jgi:hypothetical protein
MLLDGPFEDGRVRALRVPLTGRFGSRTGLAFGTACAEISWAQLQFRALQLGPTRLPVCPIGGAMVSQAPGGSARWGARLSNPVLQGRLGSSPLRLAASSGRIVGKSFNLDALALRLGRPSSPIIFDARRLEGNFVGRGVAGTFYGAKSTIGNVPLAMSDMAGKWRVYQGDLTADGGMTVSDRADPDRFYPLRSNDFHFSLAGDFVRANGSLNHPASGTKVTDVTIEHRLSTGAGHALLDVPGIRFGESLQPEELTRLTEGGHGTIALPATGTPQNPGPETLDSYIEVRTELISFLQSNGLQISVGNSAILAPQ